MCRVAWLTCALLALAHARLYERCELARDLTALGVQPEHLSTWVCIAYHESRFDTTANNPYSGDHGIFQISELYWCGPGKACGLSCASLRDDDISDDLECALQVHEEHTRLQGNGFLAWVVYPQHCKHNTKKYLVDCDTSVKGAAPITKSRAFPERYNPNVNYTVHNIESLLPSYLAIGNIFRGSYGKVLDHDRGRVDWYNYKIDNVDDLQLPQSFGRPQAVTEAPTTSTTTTTQTTTTEYVPPVKPWRVIETNQFRKKQLFDDKTTSKPSTEKKNLLTKFTYEASSIPTSTTKFQTPTTTTTTRPLTVTTTQQPVKTTTSYLPRFTLSRTPAVTTTIKPRSTTLVSRSPQSSTTKPPTTVTVATTKQENATHRRGYTLPPFTFTFKSRETSKYSTTTTALPSTQWRTIKPSSRASTISNATTARPTTRWNYERLRTATPTTIKTTTTTRKPYDVSTRSTTTAKSRDFSWYTFTSRTATTSATTKLQSAFSTTTARPFTSSILTRGFTNSTFSSTTTRPFTYFTNRPTTSTTPRPISYSTSRPITYSSTPRPVSYSTTSRPITYSTTTAKPQTTTLKPKTTQSIFDLYLNPTKPPTLRTFTFDSAADKFKIKIFASGTTTPAPGQTTTKKDSERSGLATNQVKRQTQRSAHY